MQENERPEEEQNNEQNLPNEEQQNAQSNDASEREEENTSEQQDLFSHEDINDVLKQEKEEPVQGSATQSESASNSGTRAQLLEQINLKENFMKFVNSFWAVIKSMLNFADEVDYDQSAKDIKSGIEFKGFNIWILIFSIFIASIGLNVDSTAVIIGAMLISPLMGPIMGIGFSVGVNDWSTLVRSLKNLGITAGVSVITATVYFAITPYGEAGKEIMSRTRPELLDVFVAIFGGFAGIMATTRNKVTNVIPGVAIATALMPPLCVTGYGLANLNWKIFSGAFYLFMINSVYISITTLIVVRYLKFPLKHLMDERKEKRLRRLIIAFSLLLIIPSVRTLYITYTETKFETNSEEFVKKYFNRHEIRNLQITYNDGEPVIEVDLFGKRPHAQSQLDTWKADFDLEDVQLIVNPDTRLDSLASKIEKGQYKGSKYFEEIFPVHLNQINELTITKDSLNRTIADLKKEPFDFTQIKKEVLLHFNKVEQFEYSMATITDFKSDYKVPTFAVKWKRGIGRSTAKRKNKQMEKWLKVRLTNFDTLRVINH